MKFEKFVEKYRIRRLDRERGMEHAAARPGTESSRDDFGPGIPTRWGAALSRGLEAEVVARRVVRGLEPVAVDLG
ncbi:MAG: hypothetical protein IIA41_13700 [SAR324 cluster bacterium]|nr:hypothetical protein [SAR324 cluster bacterium]